MPGISGSGSSSGRLNTYSVLAMAGIAGPLVLLASELVAALSSPEYSMLTDSISSLALTPVGWVQTFGFLAVGLLVEIFVAGLLFNIRDARGFHLSIGLLVIFGFGLLLIGAFPADPVGAPRTFEGSIHWFTAIAVFWLFPIAILLIAHSLRQDPNWQSLFVYTIVAGILALCLVVGMMFLKPRITWFGLYERIIVANMVIWVEVAAIRLLRLSLRRGVTD